MEGVQCGTKLSNIKDPSGEGIQSGTKLSNNCLLLMFILTVEDEFLIANIAEERVSN